MSLLSIFFLLSAARLIVALPSLLPPNSIIVLSTSPDQQEIELLGSDFHSFNQSLSSYCLNEQKSAYFSWKATNTQTTSFVTCKGEVREGCYNIGTFIETQPPQYVPTIKPPCCGQCVIDATKAQAIYWPTPAPQPSISTLVGADGFTL